MKVIKTSDKGINYLITVIKNKPRTITRAILWKIPHRGKQEDLRLKLGRYNKNDFLIEVLENKNPRSELTLDHEEFSNLLKFLEENYEPFKAGVSRYVPLDEEFSADNVEHLKAIFKDPDKQKVVSFITSNDILPEEILGFLELRKKQNAIKEFEDMLQEDTVEHNWQAWFKENSWVLGTDFVKVLDEREVDTDNIVDYLMQAYDGFLDIVELKRPEGDLRFWRKLLDHGNYIPSTSLVKAITQASKYIYEVEREANSVKFLERVDNVKAIKPRCLLIFGRSEDWNDDQKEAYRILNAQYHSLTILTYDQVLDRAKRIISAVN